LIKKGSKSVNVKNKVGKMKKKTDKLKSQAVYFPRFERSQGLTYSLLYDFVLLISQIYPDLLTENRFYRAKLPYGNPELQELYELLIHSLTLLNQIHREKSGRKYISEKVDVVVALSLIELFLAHSPGASTLTKNRKVRYYYGLLLEKVGEDERLTTKKILLLLGLSRSTGIRLIKEMFFCGFLRRVGGNRARGYQYQLKPLR
jgi:hypothetical protein